MLQRMRELAVQSLNGSNGTGDRINLDTEYQQLAAEIDRIATQTKFNGKAIVGVDADTTTFQVGPNSGDTSWTHHDDRRLTGRYVAAAYVNTRPAVTFTDATAAASLDINGVTVSIGALGGRTAAQAAAALAAAFDTTNAATAPPWPASRWTPPPASSRRARQPTRRWTSPTSRTSQASRPAAPTAH